MFRRRSTQERLARAYARILDDAVVGYPYLGGASQKVQDYDLAVERAETTLSYDDGHVRFTVILQGVQHVSK